MADSEAIQTVGIQSALEAVMVMREADAGPASGTTAVCLGKACRYRNGNCLEATILQLECSRQEHRMIKFVDGGHKYTSD